MAGRVLDPLGGAIAHARVTLIRDDQPVTDASSDASGHFALTSADAGRYRVHVEAQGFASKDTDPVFVAVGEQVTLDVTLTIGPLVQQVIVTATATALPESQVGASVTVLDQDVLQSLGKPDVLEALRLVPGVQVLQTGQRGGTTSLFVRGGNDDFNKVLIDGIPANDIGGSFDFGSLPVTGIDRVEVLRNPNSVLYGADALTSVVNITTRRGTSTVPELSYAIDGGTFGTLRQDLSVGGAHQRLDYFAGYSHFDTRNNVPNDAYHNGTFAGTFGWRISPSTQLVVTGHRTATAQGVPNAFDFYGIADDSSQTSRNTYLGAVLHTQTTSRWAQTVRFTSTDLQYHFVNPIADGRALRPVWVWPELSRPDRHDFRREWHQRHRAGDSGFRWHLPPDLRLTHDTAGGHGANGLQLPAEPERVCRRARRRRARLDRLGHHVHDHASQRWRVHRGAREPGRTRVSRRRRGFRSQRGVRIRRDAAAVRRLVSPTPGRPRGPGRYKAHVQRGYGHQGAQHP